MLFFSPTRWGLVIIPKFISWLSKHGRATNSYVFFSCHHIQLLREEKIKFSQVSSTFQSLFCCSISWCIKSLFFPLYLDGLWFLYLFHCLGESVEGVIHPHAISILGWHWTQSGGIFFTILLNLLEVSTSTKTSFTLNMELIYFGDVISHVLVDLVTSRHQIKHGSLLF